MTPRQRMRAVFSGEKADRMPYFFGGGPRQSTFAAWRRQGLSRQQQENWGRFLGADEGRGIGKLDTGPLPPFEEKVIEETSQWRIWRDSYGAVRKDFIRQRTPGFATRQYIEFPVKDRKSWEELKWRYDPKTAERTIPAPADKKASINPDWYRVEKGGENWRDLVEVCNKGDLPVSASVAGFYWTLRDWCGFEGLSLMFYDKPDLVREMMEFWCDFLIGLLEEPLGAIKVDHFIINEDMAYKTAAMLSPEAMRRFMLPCYERFYGFLKEKGVVCVDMDSDGHNSQILEAFYGKGIDGICPMEIAAGNDPEVYLEKHKGLFIWGGIDKRELRFTKERVRAETAKRYKTARKYGTYLPGVDHGCPPDVPLRNYLYMVELLKGFADGEDIDTYEPPCVLERELGPIEEMYDAKKNPYIDSGQ